MKIRATIILQPHYYLLLHAMKDQVTNVLGLANLVRENIRVKQLFTPHNSILVTLSGGQDSLCSLLLLYLLQNQLGLDLHARKKFTLTANSNFRFAKIRKTRVIIAIHKAACYGRGTPLLKPAHPPAKYGQPERLSGVWAARPRQLNKSVRVARFTAVRGHLLSYLGPERKVACVQPSRTRDSCSNSEPPKRVIPPKGGLPRAQPSAEQEGGLRVARVTKDRVSKLEHHSSLRPSVLIPSLAQPLTRKANERREQADSAIDNLSLLCKSTFKKTKTSVNSDFCPANPNQTLFDSADRSSCLHPKGASTHLEPLPWFCVAEPNVPERRNFRFAKVYAYPLLAAPTQKQVLSKAKVRDARLKKSSRFIVAERSLVGSPSANLEFGVLWCNHFWQRESFYTMLHVAKINLCFSSTMCFYLPIESVLSEQNAREWRHKSIQRTCAFYHYDCCTQGHTKSDRVETILFNVLRGTGIAGLQSLQWKKSFYSFSCQRFYPWVAKQPKWRLRRP